MTNDSLIECIKQLEAINYEIGFADSTLVIEGAPTSMAKQREICRKNLKLAIEQHQVEQPKVSNSTGLELLIDQLRAESDIWHGIIPCCRAEAIIRKHYEGHPAVEGKPLELMTRDELLAYIKANETGDNFNAEPKLNVSCSNEDIVKKLIVLPTYGKIIGTAFGTMICLEEAIAAMGTETAVNASKEQEEFGIAPEAAGLEPKCDQPVPANMGEESIRKDEAPAMDALADGLSPSPASVSSCARPQNNNIEEIPTSSYRMADGRPIFGEGSPHDIGEHLQAVCASVYSVQTNDAICHICKKPNDQLGDPICSGAHPREISVNRGATASILDELVHIYDSAYNVARAMNLNLLSPVERQVVWHREALNAVWLANATKPVSSVVLAKARWERERKNTERVDWEETADFVKNSYLKDAKADLDAAKEQGAQFDYVD